jgi:hypothetical protein
VTTPPQGRDDSTVAALAVQLSGLRREVQALTRQATELASTQRQHALLLEGVAELRRQIDQVLAALNDRDDDGPAAWFWLTMSEQESASKLSELTDWVETVLRAQYPDYLAGQLQPCWPNHPEARWELAWLYHLWTAAYLTDHPAPRDTADWHDRWLPGVLNRLGHVMKDCADACRLFTSV